MGFAEDKVYNHILRNMHKFRNIHVASLVDSLSCLTDADRDELHTREEVRGSNATVYKFYQHVRCRRDWVTDLINALHQNNAGHLAEELQQVYDCYRVPSPRASAPPGAPAPVPTSFPPDARPAVPSVGAQMPFQGPNSAVDAPLAEHPRCNLPTGGHPSLQPTAATAASSAASSDVSSTDLDARAPVQESLLEQKSPQPPLPMNTVCDGTRDVHSGEGPLPCPTEVQQMAAGAPGAASTVLPLAAPPEQGREWLSQRHPVCVDNGCFGNANHLHRGAPGLGLGRSLPPRDPGTARGPEQARNEPEEDVYVSTELSTRLAETACGVGPQPPDLLRTQKKLAALGSEHGETPASFVDVRSPFLIQEQFDAEQKRIRMLREHEGDGDAQVETTTPVSTPAPRDASPSCDTSLKPPVREKMLPVEEAAGSPASVPAKEKVLPASVAPFPGTNVAGSFEGTAGRMASRVNSATSIWVSHGSAEEDVELSKPGVLLSVAGESAEAAGRRLGGPSSKASDHLGLSSDPLMISTDSSSPGEALSRATSGHWFPAPVAHAEPSGEEAAGASSRPPLSWGSTSLGTHEVRVDHHPSALQEAGNDVQDGAGPFGNPPAFDSSRGHSAVTSSSQDKVPNPGDSNGPSLPYIIPAVGIALISAVAFLVYARLQK